MEEECRTSSNFHHYINIVESIISSAPPNIQCRNYLRIHYFDREMAVFPIAISQYLMVEILIRNVGVGRKISGCDTYIDKKHPVISAVLLESK